MYPAVKDLSISDKRRDTVISNIIKTFYDTAIGRKVVNLRQVNFSNGFSRLGVNLIVDKIWFVDYEESMYAHENLGLIEGKKIALSETDLILKTILSQADVEENRITLDSEIKEDNIEKAILLLNSRGLKCDSILSNVHEIMSFWYYKKFEGVSRRIDNAFGFEGRYSGIPVYWSNSVPTNTTLLVNLSVGDLLVQKQLSANILEIKEDEVESVLKNIPNLNRDDLKEKVRLIAEEVIRYDFKCKDAITIIKSNKEKRSSRN